METGANDVIDQPVLKQDLALDDGLVVLADEVLVLAGIGAHVVLVAVKRFAALLRPTCHRSG